MDGKNSDEMFGFEEVTENDHVAMDGRRLVNGRVCRICGNYFVPDEGDKFSSVCPFCKKMMGGIGEGNGGNK